MSVSCHTHSLTVETSVESSHISMHIHVHISLPAALGSRLSLGTLGRPGRSTALPRAACTSHMGGCGVVGGCPDSCAVCGGRTARAGVNYNSMIIVKKKNRR